MRLSLNTAYRNRRKTEGDPATRSTREARRGLPLLQKLSAWRVPLAVAALAAGAAAGTGLGIAATSTSTSASAPAVTAGGAAPTAAGAAPQLHVSGNKLVTASGQPVTLHGVDRSGTEYKCVQHDGIFDGPSGPSSVNMMKAYGVNAVRVPLNEACWNGESYVNPASSGARYRQAVTAYVQRLNASGMVAILDLHWTDGSYTGSASACSSAEATCQKPMPDAVGTIPFWTSVAKTFKGNDSVIFDLFNEPYPEKAAAVNGNEAEGWQ